MTMKNFEVVFDHYLSFNDHINEICHKSMYQIQRVNQLKKYLDTKSLASLVHSFLILHIDYCNILYFNLSSYSFNKLQRIQNFSACLVTQTHKFPVIKPILKQLL